MKKIFYFLLPLYLIVFAIACDKIAEPPPESSKIGTLKVRFLPMYDGKPLAMDQAVNLANTWQIKFQRLSFFCEVLNGSTPIGTTQLVDFSTIYDENAAKNGVTATFTLPEGTYPTTNLGIGVGATNNAKKPTDFEKGKPLALSDDYWDSWTSYIFTKTEGKVDKDKNGKFDHAFSYHTGTDEMFRRIGINKNISIVTGQNIDMTVEVDFKKILDGKSGAIDPIKDQNAHSLSNKAVALKIMDNYPNSVTVK
jgi:hypothetical protein